MGAYGETTQVGNSYCPTISYEIDQQIKDASTIGVSWKLNYNTNGYAIYGNMSRLYFEVDGTVLYDDTPSIYGESSYEIASGYFEMARPTETRYVYPSMYVNWGGIYWNGSYMSAETIDSDYFSVYGIEAPSAPTSVTNTRNSDTKNTVTWKAATTGGPVSSWTIRRKVNGGGWAVLKSGISAATKTYEDTTTAAGNYYQYQVFAVNAKGSSSVTSSSVTYNTPAAPTGVTNTRNSDTQNTVSWTASTSASVRSYSIQRSVNGGAYNTIATGVATTATSYADTTTSADNFYAYKVVAVAGSLESASAASSTTYNTPAAPTAISGQRTSSTAVLITLTNSSNSASGTQWQRSTDGSNWSAATTISGGPATSFTDTNAQTGYRYRARNVRGSLYSAWKAMTANLPNGLSTAAAPNINEPSANATKQTGVYFTVSWTHVPTDGSAQTKAQLDYSRDGGSTWTNSKTFNDATNSATVATSVRGEMMFRVRTAGANGTYGPYSYVTVMAENAPSISVNFPAVVSTMPIPYSISYSDGPNTFAAGTLKIVGESRSYQENIPQELSGAITPSEFIPKDGVTYTVTVNVRSSSGLTATTSTTFTVDFIPPAKADLAIEEDPLTGYAGIVVSLNDPAQGETAAQYANIYRSVNGVLKLIAENLASGTAVVDKYAPLNTDYEYVAATFAASGAVAEANFSARIDTRRFFFYWGENGIAWAEMNPKETFSLAPSKSKLIDYEGREDPVPYVGIGTSNNGSVSFTIKTMEQMDAFFEMLTKSPVCVFKNVFGKVFMAFVKLNGNYDFISVGRVGNVSLSITKVDDEGIL